jgi:hypothetical protein
VFEGEGSQKYVTFYIDGKSAQQDLQQQQKK